MIESGVLVEVVEPVEGSSATAAVAAGGSSVPVADFDDFPESGTVRVGGVDYGFTLDDDEAPSALLLASPLTVAVDEGDDVVVVSTEGQVESVVYAVVDVDRDGVSDPVWAEVRTALRPFFPPGTAAAGALVDVEYLEGQEPVAVSRPFDAPQLNQDVVRTPAISAYRTATVNVVTGGSGVTATNWTLESWSTDVIVDEAGVWRVTEPGHYTVVVTARWASNGAGRRMVWPVWYLAAGQVDGPQDNRAAEVINGFTNHIADMRYLEAGEGVAMRVFQNSGASLGLLGGPTQSTTTIRVWRLGP